MARTSIPQDFEIIMPPGPEPSSTRLALAIGRVIDDGTLHAGDPLPSTRTVAAETGVTRSTVVAAYEKLSASGYVSAKPGSMTRVAASADHRAGLTVDVSGSMTSWSSPIATGEGELPDPLYDLVPGYPDAGLINARAWATAWRRAEESARTSGWYAPEFSGAARYESHYFLRSQICVHLRRHRGIVCSPEQIFLFPSTESASTAVVEALDLAPGVAGVEEPGCVSTREVLAAAGCEIQACGVDDDGLRVADLTGRESIVHVTPMHQVPLGASMSRPRREALVRWAARTGALIVEDDFDGAFRYDGSVVPSLQNVEGGAEHVVHLGSSVRLLTSQLKLAWLVVPKRLCARFQQYCRGHGDHVCGVATRALAEFARMGALTRHMAQSRRTYSARRRAFAAECDAKLPGVELLGRGAGLHLVLELDGSLDDVAVAHDLQLRNVACLPLSPFYAAGATPRRSGLLCGDSRLHESLSAAAVDVIAETMTVFS